VQRRDELIKLVGETERSLFAAIAASDFDDETAAMAVLCACVRTLQAFMDPMIVAAILSLLARTVVDEAITEVTTTTTEVAPEVSHATHRALN
jgi:hypothetical protein